MKACSYRAAVLLLDVVGWGTEGPAEGRPAGRAGIGREGGDGRESRGRQGGQGDGREGGGRKGGRAPGTEGRGETGRQ